MKNLIVQTSRGERVIGPGYPCFIVAEISGNHDGKFEKALRIIDVACNAGVDAVKLQTFTPDTMTINCTNKWFQISGNNPWTGQTLYELYHKLRTPWEWQPKLKEYAEKKGVLLFSAAFDATSVDFLEKMNVQLYKVAGYEASDIELLKKIAETKKPVILTRAFQDIEDTRYSLDTLKKHGCPAVGVLHCVNSYPAALDQMNVRTVVDIKERFDVVSGVSDHSLGMTAALCAVSLGASIIEKHITLSRSDGGLDSAFSLEPEELKHLVAAIREVEKSLGKPTYDASEKEKVNLVFKRSIFVIQDMKKGKEFTRENIRVIRPGYGMAPKYLSAILGRTASRDIERGTPFTEELMDIS